MIESSGFKSGLEVHTCNPFTWRWRQKDPELSSLGGIIKQKFLEMSQQVKRLLCRTLIPGSHLKASRGRALVCNLSTTLLGDGRQRQENFQNLQLPWFAQ